MTRFSMARPSAALALLLAAGCGGPTHVVVTGRVLTDGKPFRPAKDELMSLVFLPAPEGGKPGLHTYLAEFGPGGAYTVAGRDGRGVPVGRYKVVVESFHDVTGVEGLGGQYGPDKTPYVVEVNAANRVLDLEVRRPSGVARR